MNYRYKTGIQIIITGAPSTGKTSIINSLKGDNYTVLDEAAREEIIAQQLSKGNAFPWNNVKQFSALVLRRILSKKLPQNSLFSDRGIPDIIAYLKMANIPVDKEYYEAVKATNYYKKVFLDPICKEIFINDDQRKESLEEAVQLQEVLIETYKDLNFEILEIPKLGLIERKLWVLEQCKGLFSSE